MGPEHDVRRAHRTARFLTALLGGAGVVHMAWPRPFDSIVPPALPGSARAYTYTSGAAELAVAGLLAVPRTPPPGGGGGGGGGGRGAPPPPRGGGAAAALFVAVFPANIQMAADAANASPGRRAVACGRLPLQGVLVAQALHVARRGRRR